MRIPSYEQLLAHPELRQQLMLAAHRERNREVWRLLGRLYQLLSAQPKPLRRSRWIAVHHGS